MASPPLSSLRGRLMLLSLLIISLFSVLLFYNALTLREREVQNTRQDALNLTTFIVDEQDRYFETARLVLPLITQIEYNALLAGGDSCNKLLGSLLENYAFASNFGFIAADGSLRCSALPPGQSIWLGDRDYFRRAMDTGSFAIGDYQVGRITGRSGMNAGYPVRSPAGDITGVLYIALDLGWIDQSLSGVAIPPDTAVTLFDRKGTILAHYPDEDITIGGSAAGWPIHRFITETGGAGTAETADHQGTPRLYGFAPLTPDNTENTVYASVGIPSASAFAPLEAMFRYNLLAMAVLVAAGCALAWVVAYRMLAQPLAALREASERLEKGDFKARTGLRSAVIEVNQLARTFDTMAESLEQRYETIAQQDAMLKRMNRALQTLSAGNRSLLRAGDEKQLMQDMCAAAVETGGYSIAWVGYAHTDEDHSVIPVAYTGVDLQFLEDLNTSWADTQAGNGPTGTAIRTRRPVVGHDVQANPDYAAWHERLRRRDIYSAIALPLKDNGSVIGAFTIYSSDPHAFDTREQSILEEMADDLSFGIRTLRLKRRHEEAEERIHQMAFFDSLTALPNHIKFQELLEECLDEKSRPATNCAVFIVGMDRFRDINSTLGFDAGDRVLRETARRLQQTTGPSETLAKLRGDEFAMLLPGVEADGATKRAASILDKLDKLYSLDGFSLAITASIGIVLFPEHSDAAEQLLRKADMALQQAKHSPARHAFYSQHYDRDRTNYLSLAGKLHRALEGNELTPYYQPKICMESGRIVGFEALARWFHPREGMIPPDIFIALAESTGMIRAVSNWVIEAVMKQLADWREQNINLPIAINISARNLHDPCFMEQLERQTALWHPAPGQFEIEVTEEAIIENVESAGAVLTLLREKGVPVYIDDFGTGYSSLSTLKQHPFSALKIDKSFVLEMMRDKEAETIVKSTIHLAHDMNLTAVAEGVEDKDTWCRLKELGCDIGQGYYMGRPMPQSDVLSWLRESPWGLEQVLS